MSCVNQIGGPFYRVICVVLTGKRETILQPRMERHMWTGRSRVEARWGIYRVSGISVGIGTRMSRTGSKR
jgi:hypothetical protein